MKIIAVDNFDREMFSDLLIASNVDERHGNVMVAALNAKFCNHEHADRYYRLVADEHKLFVYEP